MAASSLVAPRASAAFVRTRKSSLFKRSTRNVVRPSACASPQNNATINIAALSGRLAISPSIVSSFDDEEADTTQRILLIVARRVFWARSFRDVWGELLGAGAF